MTEVYSLIAPDFQRGYFVLGKDLSKDFFYVTQFIYFPIYGVAEFAMYLEPPWD